MCLRSHFFKLILILFASINLKLHAHADSFYVSCYYYDSDKSLKSNTNPSLMKPSKLYFGNATNYYWALQRKDKYLKLNGKVVDGFFIEDKLTQQEIVEACHLAIKNGSFFGKPKKTFKLYDYKASVSNYSSYEYPIRFLKESNNNIEQKIKQIVLFGDSLSDTGNLKRWTKYMPGYPGFFGRFSDFFIWIDFLSGKEADFGSKIPVLNFAYGGAKTDGENDFFKHNFKNFINSFGRNFVTGSSRNYIHNYLNRYLTEDSYVSKSPFISNPDETLYAIWIGANDYISKLETPSLIQEFFDNPNENGGANEVNIKSVNNIYNQILELSKSHAKHFVVLNLPDFGKTSWTLESHYVDKSINNPTDKDNKEAFATKISAVIKNHNEYLKQKMNELENLGIDVTLVDIYKGFDYLLENKNFLDDSYFDYGFQKLDSQYKFPNTDIVIAEPCYKGRYIDSALAWTQSDDEANALAIQRSCHIEQNNNKELNLDSISPFTIFWNSPHPSSYTHCWISFFVRHELEKKGLFNNSYNNLEEIKRKCLSTINAKYSE